MCTITLLYTPSVFATDKFGKVRLSLGDVLRFKCCRVILAGVDAIANELHTTLWDRASKLHTNGGAKELNIMMLNRPVIRLQRTDKSPAHAYFITESYLALRIERQSQFFSLFTEIY